MVIWDDAPEEVIIDSIAQLKNISNE